MKKQYKWVATSKSWESILARQVTMAASRLATAHTYRRLTLTQINALHVTVAGWLQGIIACAQHSQIPECTNPRKK